MRSAFYVLLVNHTERLRVFGKWYEGFYDVAQQA